MSIMSKFEDKTFLYQKEVYGFGPWCVSKMRDEDNTFDQVVHQWKTNLNAAIIEHVNNRSVVVQAGGWQGLYPFLLSNMFDLVYTFEPHPLNFYCLTKNCQRKNIVKFQAAVGDVCGLIDFEETEATGQHRVPTRENYPIKITDKFKVPCLTIDSLNLTNCGFIMLDVENFELSAILGTTKTIKKFRPVICVEKSFNSLNDNAVARVLREFGYSQICETEFDLFFKNLRI